MEGHVRSLMTEPGSRATTGFLSASSALFHTYSNRNRCFRSEIMLCCAGFKPKFLVVFGVRGREGQIDGWPNSPGVEVMKPAKKT